MQAQLVSDLGGIHGVGQILLVGEDKQQCIPKFVLIQHSLQFLASLNDTITVIAVDYEDDSLGVLEVMPPQRSNLVLSTDIPDCELDVFVLDRLDIEAYVIFASVTPLFQCPVTRVVLRTDSRNCGHDFTKLQLIEDGRLSGSIQSDHENAHLLLAPEAIEQLRERETHLGGVREMNRKG